MSAKYRAARSELENFVDANFRRPLAEVPELEMLRRLKSSDPSEFWWLASETLNRLAADQRLRERFNVSSLPAKNKVFWLVAAFLYRETYTT